MSLNKSYKKSSKQVSFVDKRSAELWESGAWSFYIWVGYISSWIMMGLGLFILPDSIQKGRLDVPISIFIFGLAVFLILFFLRRKMKRELVKRRLIEK